MDYTTDDIPAGLKIIEHPPGQFAWVIEQQRDDPSEAPSTNPRQGDDVRVRSHDGYASYEEAMKAGRAAMGLSS